MKINIEDMSIEEVEKVVNSWYSAVSPYKMENLMGKLDREFTKEEVDKVLEEADEKDPFKIPFNTIVRKYYEPTELSEDMDNIEKIVTRFLHAILEWRCRANIQDYDNYTRIYYLYRKIDKIKESTYTKDRFIKWYNENIDEAYKIAIGRTYNDIYFLENVSKIDPVSMTRYTRYKYTCKIPYPMPEEFNLLTLSHNKLANYLHDNESIRRKEKCSPIETKEAIENIPDDVIERMNTIAKNYASVIAAKRNVW